MKVKELIERLKEVSAPLKLGMDSEVVFTSFNFSEISILSIYPFPFETGYDTTQNDVVCIDFGND